MASLTLNPMAIVTASPSVTVDDREFGDHSGAPAGKRRLIMAETQIYRRRVVVNSDQGLHIRPCTMLAQTAMKYQSRVRLLKDGRDVDAKSILELMTLAATGGTALDLEVDGTDAAECMEQIAALFDSSFALVSSAQAVIPTH